MSALGQKQTLKRFHPMSALPPIADIGTHSRNVRFVPKADICSAAKILLFDDLVGAGKQGFGHRQAERVCCLQVDGEFVLVRRLHRQITGFLAA